VRDPWLAGAPYERYVGRWSRLVAREFVPWLAVAPGSAWLDVGCGAGALAETVVRFASPTEVMGVDRSPGFARHASAHVEGAAFAVADAGSLPFRDARFVAAVAGLVLNFLPDPVSALSEMRRVARHAVGAYVWDYAGEMQMLRRFWDAAVALDPGAAAKDEGVRFPMCRPAGLLELFGCAGLRRIECRAIDVPMVFRDFDDLWEPFLGGQGPAPAHVASLDDEPRGRLRDRLRAALPVERDGSVHLVARAWAVRGRT
jgi:SAM-dependent methyltransferase